MAHYGGLLDTTLVDPSAMSPGKLTALANHRPTRALLHFPACAICYDYHALASPRTFTFADRCITLVDGLAIHTLRLKHLTYSRPSGLSYEVARPSYIWTNNMPRRLICVQASTYFGMANALFILCKTV